MVTRKMAVGIILVVAASCLVIAPKALALSNKDRIQMLDDKFIKGEISEQAYKRLLKKYRGKNR